MNPEYLPCIKKVIITIDQNVGIAGGRGAGSFYFSGIINPESDDPHLIYLDPHTTQLASDEMTDDHLQTYSCKQVRTLQLSKICTGVAIGFYLKDRDSFDAFSIQIQKLAMEKDSVFSVFYD